MSVRDVLKVAVTVDMCQHNLFSAYLW